MKGFGDLAGSFQYGEILSFTRCLFLFVPHA